MRNYIGLLLILVLLSVFAASAEAAIYSGTENAIISYEVNNTWGIRDVVLFPVDRTDSEGTLIFEARGVYSWEPDPYGIVSFDLDGKWFASVDAGTADEYIQDNGIMGTVVRDTMRHAWTIPAEAMRDITFDRRIGMTITSLHGLLVLNPFASVSWSLHYDLVPQPPPPPVPIPSSVLLLGTGLIGVVGFRKRFKKA